MSDQVNSPVGESVPSGTVVSWQEGIGDDMRYHIAHVSSAGVIVLAKVGNHEHWESLQEQVAESPNEANDFLRQHPKAAYVSAGDIAKVTYSKDLNQLSVFDKAGQKTKVPLGKEQAEVFSAIQQYLGGNEGEEEADAWSVMQTPLFVLSVIAVIGGFFIWFTTICEADYEASGRRSGMKNLLNWVGYQIGPFWMSVAVGALAALVLGGMIRHLIKRPILSVLSYGE